MMFVMEWPGVESRDSREALLRDLAASAEEQRVDTPGARAFLARYVALP